MKAVSYRIDENEIWQTPKFIGYTGERLVRNYLSYEEVVGTAPCEKGCWWVSYCATNAVACKHFQDYVRGDMDATPWEGPGKPEMRIAVTRDC